MAWLRSWCASAVLALMTGCAQDTEQSSGEQTVCDRSCLIDVAHATAMNMRALPASARFTENGADTPPADSFLARATELDIHDEYADVQRGAVIVVGTALDRDARAGVFGLRLQLQAAQVTEAELIITHQGEVSVFPPAVPLSRQPLFSALVPEAERTPEARMREIADAYFDGIEVDSGASVPVTDDCNRLENGVQTTNSDTFNNLRCNTLEIFDYIPEVRERRYPLFDADRGVISALVAFYIPGGDYPRVVDGMQTTRHYDSRSLFLMESFKIEAGKIRLIEATMRNMPLGASMGWNAPARR